MDTVLLLAATAATLDPPLSIAKGFTPGLLETASHNTFTRVCVSRVASYTAKQPLTEVLYR